jgi:DNA-binding transcriptional LysR family regulator
VSLPLPVQLPAMTVFMLWHPRMEADPAHRWLRHCVRDICGTAL